MSTEQIAVVLAGLSLVVSAQVAWRAHQQTGRAHFTAQWVTSSEVVYTNHGPGAAREVTVTRVPEPRVSSHDEPRHEYVAALQSLSLHGTRTLMEQPTERVAITWRDNRRRVQSATIELGPPPREPRRAPEPRQRDTVDAAIRRIAREEVDALEQKAVSGHRRRR